MAILFYAAPNAQWYDYTTDTYWPYYMPGYDNTSWGYGPSHPGYLAWGGCPLHCVWIAMQNRTDGSSSGGWWDDFRPTKMKISFSESDASPATTGVWLYNGNGDIIYQIPQTGYSSGEELDLSGISWGGTGDPLKDIWRIRCYGSAEMLVTGIEFYA